MKIYILTYGNQVEPFVNLDTARTEAIKVGEMIIGADRLSDPPIFIQSPGMWQLQDSNGDLTGIKIKARVLDER